MKVIISAEDEVNLSRVDLDFLPNKGDKIDIPDAYMNPKYIRYEVVEIRHTISLSDPQDKIKLIKIIVRLMGEEKDKDGG